MRLMGMALLVFFFAVGSASAQNPLLDIMAELKCEKAGNVWRDGECRVKDEEPYSQPLDEPNAGAVPVVLTKKLTKQEVPLERIGLLCLSWPRPDESIFPMYEVYACLLLDGQWWSARYHYKPDICGPVGVAFFKGVHPLRMILANLQVNAFESVSDEHLRSSRVFVGVKHVCKEIVYLKELVVK